MGNPEKHAVAVPAFGLGDIDSWSSMPAYRPLCQSRRANCPAERRRFPLPDLRWDIKLLHLRRAIMIASSILQRF